MLGLLQPKYIVAVNIVVPILVCYNRHLLTVGYTNAVGTERQSWQSFRYISISRNTTSYKYLKS